VTCCGFTSHGRSHIVTWQVLISEFSFSSQLPLLVSPFRTLLSPSSKTRNARYPSTTCVDALTIFTIHWVYGELVPLSNSETAKSARRVICGSLVLAGDIPPTNIIPSLRFCLSLFSGSTLSSGAHSDFTTLASRRELSVNDRCNSTLHIFTGEE